MNTKKYLASILLLAASAAMPLWAQHPGLAKQKAQPLLEKHFGRSLDVSELTEVKLPLSAADAPLKAFNLDGGGFALLHYGSGEPALIGYSDRGSFSEEGMPEPLRQWIQDIAVQQPSHAAQAPFHCDFTPVAPLLRTQWGQREPFNAQCPTYDDVPTPTGCSAVSLAQVLYYYQAANTSDVVEQYVNKATGTEITVDYSRGRYDWDNMLPAYDEGSYTEQQAEAVARLMFEAGVACHCQYGQYATSGSVPFVALQHHYDFECNYYYRPFVSTEMWMNVIQQNLLDGRPVIYSGGSGGVGSVNVSGHGFVVDGIDASGFCHVNWGWAGLDDGYYNIAFCNPPSADRGFVSQQSMIADIRPRTAGEHYEPRLVQAGAVLGQYYSAVTTNSYDKHDYQVKSGLIADGATADEANILAYTGGSDLTNLAYPGIQLKGSNGAVVRDGSYTFPLSDGTYKYCLLYADKGDDASFTMARWPEEFMTSVELKDGKIVGDDNGNDSTLLHALQPVSDACNGSYFYVMLDIESSKLVRGNKVYASSLPPISFQNVETGVKYANEVSFYDPCYYPGVRYQTVCRLKPVNPDNGFTMPAGTYRFLFGEPNVRWANATDHDHLLTIAPKPDYPLLDVNVESMKVLQRSEYYDYDTPVFFPYRAYSANNVGGRVVVNIYATREGDDEETFVCSIPDVEVNANSEINAKYTMPVRLYPLMGAYWFNYRYLTPDGERSLLNPNARGERIFVWRQTGIGENGVILEATSQLAPQQLPLPAPSSAASSAHSLFPGADAHALPGGEAPSATAGETLSLRVRNRGGNTFAGTISATFVNTATGHYLKAESPAVSIGSTEEVEVMFSVCLPQEGTYDVYFDALVEGRTTAVAVLRDDLQLRAHQTLTVGTSGIEPLPSLQGSGQGRDFPLKGREGVYDLTGRKLLPAPPHSCSPTPLKKGVYIVNGRKRVVN